MFKSILLAIDINDPDGAVRCTKAAVEIALEQGGELLVGGKEIDGPGFFFEPTLTGFFQALFPGAFFHSHATKILGKSQDQARSRQRDSEEIVGHVQEYTILECCRRWR